MATWLWAGKEEGGKVGTGGIECGCVSSGPRTDNDHIVGHLKIERLPAACVVPRMAQLHQVGQASLDALEPTLTCCWLKLSAKIANLSVVGAPTEGSQVSIAVKGGGQVKGEVIKTVKGVVMVNVFGAAPPVGSTVRLSWPGQTERMVPEGVVAVVNGSSIAIRFDAEQIEALERPNQRLQTVRVPIIWIDSDRHVIIDMLDTSNEGFEFQSVERLPFEVDLLFRIALQGQFHTVKGRVASCKECEPGVFQGSVHIVGASRLDQSEWSQCRKSA